MPTLREFQSQRPNRILYETITFYNSVFGYVRLVNNQIFPKTLGGQIYTPCRMELTESQQSNTPILDSTVKFSRLAQDFKQKLKLWKAYARITPIFPVLVWEEQRVVTTETLAQGYGTEAIRIQQNHIRNESRFVEGVHFFNLKGGDLRAFKNRLSSSESVGKNARSLTLWTEKGAARMSKIIDTDEAWNFFERLEDSYFRPAPVVGIPLTYEAALEDLLTKVKENRIVTEQRDRAVKEKLWISEKREVTAMTTASVAVREKNKLAERIGEGKKFAAIIPVEKKLGRKFRWQPLRKWCRDNDVVPHDVDDPRFGTVKSWPRAAWLAVYDIDLRKLF